MAATHTELTNVVRTMDALGKHGPLVARDVRRADAIRDAAAWLRMSRGSRESVLYALEQVEPLTTNKIMGADLAESACAGLIRML